MNKIAKKAAVLLVGCLLISFGVSAVQAKTDKHAQQHTKQPQQQSPIVVEGDNVSFDDLTGDVLAEGDVTVKQDQETLFSGVIHGNTKKTEVWIDGVLTFIQPGAKLVGQTLHYNYTSHIGDIGAVQGIIDKEHVTGKKIDLLPDRYVIYNGTTTRCPAKVPDYHVSASKVIIWPGEKLIAYNAEFWIKNKVIFTLPIYEHSLRKDDNDKSEFPRLGYTSRDGVSISQYWEYPLFNHLAAYVDLDYYSKAKFKPSAGLVDRESQYTIRIEDGNFRDGNGNWIKKEPEFDFSLTPHRLGHLPVTCTFTGIYGKWIDTNKSSWHQDYTLYFSRDPIRINSSTTLNLGTGFEKILESYGSSTNSLWRYDVTLDKVFSPKLSTWIGYSYLQNNASLFAYDSSDLAKQLTTGFSYRIDRKNVIALNQTYDMSTHQVHDQDWTWTHNLHCWQADITYRAKRHEWQCDLSTIRW